MARLLYTILLYVAAPLIPLRLFWRSIKSPAYRRRWPERWGFSKFEPPRESIWLHAASVGESIAAAPLVRRLLEEDPQRRLIFTTMTPAGSKQVRRLFGEAVCHVYAPYDFPGAARRFLRRARPRLLVLVETELWLNWVHFCRRFEIPVILVNARMSARSARRYVRFLKPLGLLSPLLDGLTQVAARSEHDRRRFIALGLSAARCQTFGNLKADARIDQALRQQAAELEQRWLGGQRLAWVAASVHKAEIELVLDAFDILRSRLEQPPMLILVPRHPESFPDAIKACEARFLEFVTRSSGRDPSPATQIVVGDTMGELPLLLGLADFAFVGGSLIPAGGQNPLEPALWGAPILSGPHMFNFDDIDRELRAAGGLLRVAHAADLARRAEELSLDDELRARLGKAALEVVVKNRGSVARYAQLIERLWSAAQRPSSN